MIFYLAFFVLCPIIIAFTWSYSIYSGAQDNGDVKATSIFLMLMFSTFIILGSLIWHSNKWQVSKFVMIFFGLGALSAWLFTIVVSLTDDNYTYTGFFAILLSTNFLPACYILNQLTIWKDIPLYSLFKNLAFSIMNRTEEE